MFIRLALAIAFGVIADSLLLAQSLTDLTSWTLVEDPPRANLGGGATADEIVLTSTGRTRIGDGIGFASIDGTCFDDSTAGFVFNPGQDFTVAVDHRLSSIGLFGAAGLGLRVGESIDGANSVSVITRIASISLNNVGVSVEGRGLVDDTLLPESGRFFPASLQGRFFVTYEAATGDMIVGRNASLGSSSATVTKRFAGIQNQWNDEPLVVSVFLQGETPNFGSGGTTGISTGDLTARFSAFEVLDGTPSRVPEPSSAVSMLALAAVLYASDGSRRFGDTCSIAPCI